MKENIKTIFWALIIAGVIRSLMFEPFHIPSGSMKANLLVGDFIIVSKSSYGYSRYSFPFAMFPFKGRIFSEKPERGDVVVFRLPTNTRVNYIKRLVGLPGDKVQVVRGELYINGKLVPREYAGDFYDDKKGYINKYEEFLPSGRSYEVLDEIPNSLKDNTPIYEVPEHYYFFMGDNRDNSQDSRFLKEVGFVHEDNLIGEAKFIFMSSKDSLLKFWFWYKNIRFNRIFAGIE